MVNEEEKRVLTEEVVQKSDRRKEKRSDYSKTRMITYTALLAALLCVLSPWAIPVGPVPISLGLLAVYIVSSLINFKYGAVAVTVFVLLGAFGVPVFTGFTGGFAKVAGPTGGYILGYLPCSLIIGLFVDRFEKRLWVYPLAMLAGTAVLYSFGTVWFVISTGATLKTALTVCVIPFLLGDAIKIVAATALCYKLRFVLKKSLKNAKSRV